MILFDSKINASKNMLALRQLHQEDFRLEEPENARRDGNFVRIRKIRSRATVVRIAAVLAAIRGPVLESGNLLRSKTSTDL